MTAVIWMLAWLPQVLPAMSKLPQPVNVTLSSSHFIHLLKWERGPGTPAGVHYNVTVQTDAGTDLVPVAGCEHVQHPLVCNLTEAFSVRDEMYFTRIKALLEAEESQEVILRDFKPNRNTELELPRLTVTACGKNLCVDLQPPMEHLREHYDSLNYKLRISSADRAQFFKDTKSLKRKIFSDLASGREYCVSVCFSDTEVPRHSNYSKPVCHFTAGRYSADWFISALLCLLVICGVVVMALLVSAGYICLRRRPLPSVLSSIHHMEEGLVVASRCTSRSSLLNIKAMLPSAAHKRSSRTSDDSDEESVTELTGGSAGGRGGGYKLRPGTNLSSSSCSSSSSSLSACPQSGSPPKQTSGVFSLPPEASADCDSGVKERLSLHTDSHSENLPKTDPDSHPGPAHTHCLTLGRALPEEEEKEVMVEEDSQDVNLLTLTFGRQEEEEEEEEETKPEPSSASEVYDTTSTPPSLTRDTKEVTMETVSCSVNAKEEREEEEKECSGYMVRPCQDVLQNFL